ncbi:hypothetical protein GCM10007094_23490 [Pseudovibrio japonicus]|uniref:Peptidase M15C domain-containing protein n=1 Tax=Pseudovibrio japonicus TaxID=366534 RepID=A0ABQ3EEL4_9HYPH|nr:hypothetical protein [Pseudovibrio japonicus]GHB33880.1 hypothetical protein GCM10007094_23490 [Pseudovibrio japonicus]
MNEDYSQLSKPAGEANALFVNDDQGLIKARPIGGWSKSPYLIDRRWLRDDLIEALEQNFLKHVGWSRSFAAMAAMQNAAAAFLGHPKRVNLGEARVGWYERMYSIVCDETNNSAESFRRGHLNVTISYTSIENSLLMDLGYRDLLSTASRQVISYIEQFRQPIYSIGWDFANDALHFDILNWGKR